MNARHIAGLLVVLVFFGVAGPVCSQTRYAAETAKIVDLLDEGIDTAAFTDPMTLKDALRMIQGRFEKKGKELSILIDDAAFKAENAEAPSMYDEQVQLPAVPKQMPLRTALHIMLSQVRTNNATYLIRQGQIEITTGDETTMEWLLGERVRARFTKVPLQDVLAELSAMTGAPIALDARTKEKGQEPVTILLNNLSLEDALTALTEQAGLAFVPMLTGVFVTTPAEAKVVQQREKAKAKRRYSEPRKQRLVEPAA